MITSGSARVAGNKMHKTKWCVGSNLFSAWRYMSEEEQNRQRRELTEFTEVEPWYPSLRGQFN